MKLIMNIALLCAALVIPVSVLSQTIEEEVYVRSFDGAYIAGYLRIPPGDGPHPAIMFIHGGIGGSGMRGVSGGRGYVQNHFFAARYATFEVDYRRFHFGDEELEDIVACYRYLRSRPEVDASRVGVIGGSHGGYLALMLATRETPAAVVSFAGLVDIVGMFYEEGSKQAPELSGNFEWREQRYHQGKSIKEESELMDKGLLDTPSGRRTSSAGQEVTQDVAARWGSNIEIYKRYSPKEQYQLIQGPLMYLAGSEDRLHVAGEELIQNLQKLGRVAVYSEHPGMRHGFYWGTRPDEDGNLPTEFYRSLKNTSDFMRQHVLRPEK